MDADFQHPPKYIQEFINLSNKTEYSENIYWVFGIVLTGKYKNKKNENE